MTSFRNDETSPKADHCQFCDCLRQLVFQAKDCIEDLKTEIDEWKEACAEKDAELRSIYHKLFNDKVGIEKQIDFNEDIKTVHYDSDKPVISGELGTMKNYIKENKRHIRSRSRNNEKKHSQHPASSTYSAKRKVKPNLKKVKEALFTTDET
jgi:hypothetical protein